MSDARMPIDGVIGDHRRTPEDIIRDLAASDEFRELVSQAVAHSSNPGSEGNQMTFGTQVRHNLARELSGPEAMPGAAGADHSQNFPTQTPLG